MKILNKYKVELQFIFLFLLILALTFTSYYAGKNAAKVEYIKEKIENLKTQ